MNYHSRGLFLEQPCQLHPVFFRVWKFGDSSCPVFDEDAYEVAKSSTLKVNLQSYWFNLF